MCQLRVSLLSNVIFLNLIIYSDFNYYPTNPIYILIDGSYKFNIRIK